MNLSTNSTIEQILTNLQESQFAGFIAKNIAVSGSNITSFGYVIGFFVKLIQDSTEGFLCDATAIYSGSVSGATHFMGVSVVIDSSQAIFQLHTT